MGTPPSLACVRTEVSRHTDITQRAPGQELDSAMDSLIQIPVGLSSVWLGVHGEEGRPPHSLHHTGTLLLWHKVQHMVLAEV